MNSRFEQDKDHLTLIVGSLFINDGLEEINDMNLLNPLPYMGEFSTLIFYNQLTLTKGEIVSINVFEIYTLDSCN